MLLQEDPALEEILVELLVQEPGATAKRLEQLLKSRNQSYTLRAIYKELNKLEHRSILFKSGESYNLRLAWIMNLLDFGDRAYEQYTTRPYLVESLKHEDSSKTEHFNDLRKLDRFWTQLILALHHIYPNKTMCLWIPYQWFHLAHYFTVQQFFKAIDLAGHKRCHIIGSDSFISRMALKDLPKNGKYSFSKSPFEQERSTYYTVIGDAIVTVKLDKQITQKLHDLFNKVKRLSDLNHPELEEIFSSKVKTSLKCERNAEKANRFKNKFAEFFGVDVD